jgi:hypothetical protein
VVSVSSGSLGAQQPEDPCHATRILRLTRARRLDRGATGARLERDYEAAGMADRGGRRHSQYYAQSVLAMACSHQGDCSGGLAITAAPSCHRRPWPAIACYQLLSAAASPSVARHATLALG